MKYLKYTFILFALFELLATYGSLTSTPASINADFGGEFMTNEAMHFVKAFGYATFSISIISIIGFWVKDKLGLLALIVGFLVYNLCFTYSCYVDMHLSSKYQIGFYGHMVFSVLFAVLLLMNIQKK